MDRPKAVVIGAAAEELAQGVNDHRWISTPTSPSRRVLGLKRCGDRVTPDKQRETYHDPLSDKEPPHTPEDSSTPRTARHPTSCPTPRSDKEWPQLPGQQDTPLKGGPGQSSALGEAPVPLTPTRPAEPRDRRSRRVAFGELLDLSGEIAERGCWTSQLLHWVTMRVTWASSPSDQEGDLGVFIGSQRQ